MAKKVLVTGGTGFIGSHLAELLVKKNFKVTVFDRYNTNYNNFYGGSVTQFYNSVFQNNLKVKKAKNKEIIDKRFNAFRK